MLRYNGATGAFIDVFVSAGSGGLDQPEDLTFGPDGNLYVGRQSASVAVPALGDWGLWFMTGLVLSAGVLFLKWSRRPKRSLS